VRKGRKVFWFFFSKKNILCFRSDKVRGPMTSAPKVLSYQLTTLDELATERVLGFRDIFQAQKFDLLPAHTLEVPPLTWGDTDFVRPGIKEAAPQGLSGLQLKAPAVAAWNLRNATILGRYGMVTVDGCVLSDTLYHVPLHEMPGAGPGEGNTFRLPDPPRRRAANSAYHLLACNQNNYFHWLLDCIFRYQPEAYQLAVAASGQASRPPVVVPPADTSWKAMSVDAAIPALVPRLVLSAEDKLTVEQLLFVPDITGAGFNPHPALLAAYDRILAAVTGSSHPPATGRKLYISRRDSKNRVLVNESEIQAVAESVGCTSVMLSDLSFNEQVRLFSEASLIVAPHGAGLTNIGFCRPGTTLCELHMESYVHWSFRRLAALRGLNYGCLVGETWAGPEHSSTGQAWRLDPGRLRHVLKTLVPGVGEGWLGRLWTRGRKTLLF
jgi:hypothetical protein